MGEDQAGKPPPGSLPILRQHAKPDVLRHDHSVQSCRQGEQLVILQSRGSFFGGREHGYSPKPQLQDYRSRHMDIRIYCQVAGISDKASCRRLPSLLCRRFPNRRVPRKPALPTWKSAARQVWKPAAL
jgi:hypothetical protein